MNRFETFKIERVRGIQPLDRNEQSAVDGGVMPVYGENGEVITCTDPRRWGGATLFPTPGYLKY